MSEINWAKLENRRVHGRLPDTHSVYRSPIKYIHKRKWWEKEKRAEPPAMPSGQLKSGTLDKHVWKNGILDTLFDGLEDEIKRVNKKLGLEYGRRWCDG